MNAILFALLCTMISLVAMGITVWIGIKYDIYNTPATILYGIITLALALIVGSIAF